MPHSQFRFLLILLVSAIGLAGVAIFILQPPQSLEEANVKTLGSTVSSYIPKLPSRPSKQGPPKPAPKYAYITFLEDFSGANKAEDAESTEEEDAYYTATRVLGHQLMHAPSTRSQDSLPFIVLCSDVSLEKRNQLSQDGAIVIPIDPIPDPAWLNTRQQWRGVMTKLRVFEQVRYDKLLFLDADMLIVRPLDGIFSDPGTEILPVKSNNSPSSPPAATSTASAALPPTYLLAAQAQQISRNHPYPPSPSLTWFCSGFFVFAPSHTLFTYYLSLLAIPDLFDPFYPDQNLLNYAHDQEKSTMPWTEFNYTWTTTFPTYKEYELGAASLHEKYWMEEYRAEEYGQDKLGRMWLDAKEAMEKDYGWRKETKERKVERIEGERREEENDDE